MRWGVLLVCAASACQGAGDKAAVDGGVADGAQASTDLAGCLDKGGTPPDGGICVLEVTGQVVDQTGAPLDKIPLTVCGEVCTYGVSATGAFDVHVSRHILIDHYSVSVHGRPTRVSYFAPLPALMGDVASFSSPLPLPDLPASGTAIVLDNSAQTLVSADVKLILAQGTNVTLDVVDMDTDLGRQFRVTAVKDPSSLPLFPMTPAADMLFSLNPFEAVFSAKTQLSFPNSAKLPAGAAVDVLEMRTLTTGAPKPSGVFDPVATAHVTSDGTRIEMNPGEGVTFLTWIALRKKI